MMWRVAAAEVQSGETASRRTSVSNPLTMPPRADVLLMAIGVLAVSTSGPLMAAIVAPALADAMWRNALALLAIWPTALLRRRPELRALSRRELTWAVGGGVLLAGHLGTWVPSLHFTSVASATALVCTQPVWVALIARSMGHHVPRRTWVGMAVAFVGVMLLTGVDLSLSPRALAGDLLAVLGGLFAAFYTVTSAEVRKSVSTTTYTAICYSTAGLLLFGVCLSAGIQTTGFSDRTWLQLAALTLGAQLLAVLEVVGELG